MKGQKTIRPRKSHRGGSASKSAETKKKSPLIQVGATVRLSGGNGTKRKYNNQEAVVVEIPLQGCWIKVSIAVKDDVGETLPWRKSGAQPIVVVPANSSGGTHRKKADPVGMIDRECCNIIYSFLAGEPEAEEEDSRPINLPPLTNIVWMWSHVATIHSQLRTVSKTWKKTFDSLVDASVGLVDANLDAFATNPKVIQPMIKWMCRHHIALGALNFDASLADIPLLIQLLTKCNTNQLYKMRAYVNRENQEQATYGRISRLSKDGRSKLQPIDLSVARPSFFARSQKELHNAISFTCPKLKELEICMTFPSTTPDYSEYISEYLFSRPTIQKLKIMIGYYHFEGLRERIFRRIEGNVFTTLVKDLSALRELAISTTYLDHPLYYKRLYHVESDTLEVLDVRGMPRASVGVSCRCPRLRKYTCFAGFKGNGTLPAPLLSIQQHSLLEQNRVQDLILVKRDHGFAPRLRVPDDCQITLCDYFSIGRHAQALMLRRMQSGNFETWEERTSVPGVPRYS